MSNVVKLTMELDNGTTWEMIGQDAKNYMEYLRGCEGMNYVHGGDMYQPKWKKVETDKIK